MTDVEQPLFDRVDGEAFFVRLVDRFYAGVVEDPVLRPLYPDDDLDGARARLTGFLVQFWGGPTTYSDTRGHPRLRMRHAPFVIGDAERRAWLTHMTAAVAAARGGGRDRRRRRGADALLLPAGGPAHGERTPTPGATGRADPRLSIRPEPRMTRRRSTISGPEAHQAVPVGRSRWSRTRGRPPAEGPIPRTGPTGGAMTKSELIAEIAENTGMAKSDVEKCMKGFEDVVHRVVARGQGEADACRAS